MNEKQQHLLKLVKEVDSFCREHDIKYYCSGGTVLGAVRHKGFIPWDDDIDMFFPRREFEKFVDLFEKYGPKDRKIEFYERNHEHHTPVARYHEEGSSMFMHYNMIGYSSAGILLDIFILDPIPAGYDLQREHLAKFFAYADLVCPVMNCSYRLPTKYIHMLEKYEAEAKKRGTDTVAMELSKELFSYDEDECDYYVLRWGTLPFIMPKKLFGTPLYVDFEDTQIPIPEMWPQYLAVQYGCDWTDIPYVNLRQSHNTIYYPGKDYHEVYELRDKYFRQDDLLRMYNGRKMKFLKLYAAERPLEEYANELQTKVCLTEISHNLEKAGAKSAAELFAAGEYGKILEVYSPYLTRQTSPAFMGMLKHSYYYNWLYPNIIPLDEETLSCIMWSLVYTGKLRQAEKLAGVYFRANKSTEATDAVLTLMDQIEEAAKLYYTGRYDEAEKYIKGIEGYERVSYLTGYLWLTLVRTGIDDKAAAELESLATGAGADQFVRKAWADYLWEQGRRDEAEKLYQELMQTCRNGMFLWDINAKGVEIDPISLDQPEIISEDDLTRCQKQLFDEIDSVCAAEDLTYTVEEDYLTDNPTITMNVASALRLMHKLGKNLPANRRLISWESGDVSRDLYMRYVNTDTVQVNLRHSGVLSEQYVGVRINILVPDNMSALRTKIAESLRMGVRVMDADPTVQWRYASGRKRRVYRMLDGLSERQKKRLRRLAFRAYMKASQTGKINEDELEVAEDEDASDDDEDEEVAKNRRPTIFKIRSAEISASELFTPEEIARYKSLPWAEYGKLRSQAKVYDNRIRDTKLGFYEKVRELFDTELGIDSTGPKKKTLSGN